MQDQVLRQRRQETFSVEQHSTIPKNMSGHCAYEKQPNPLAPNRQSTDARIDIFVPM